MSVDKVYCMSSYLAFRYIEDPEKDFCDGMHHQLFQPIPEEERIPVWTAQDIDREIRTQFQKIRDKKKGILLSGGMDSAVLASYMGGCDAYTFRFLGGSFQEEELKRAETYAARYGLKLHYVDIDWETVKGLTDGLLRAKAAPVHSIEPQILQGALLAKADGIEMMIIGESADLHFGGMDQLLSKDWSVEDFAGRYIFLEPEEALTEAADVRYLFERYRMDQDKIDFLKFMDEVYAVESPGSYRNAFAVADMPYLDPYASLKMAMPLDLERVRRGQSKYLIRELFAAKYPDIPVPEKVPMPRPVDAFFADWTGPVRKEFKKDLDLSHFTGNQKWQLWCLERFLDLIEPR